MSIVEIESKCYRECLEYGRKKLLEELEIRDEELAKERDKSRYRSKGFGSSCIKTVMGPVEFRRRRYYDTEECRFVFLLDEDLEMCGYGKISPMIVTAAVKAASEATYREAAREITDVTGLSISHQTVWSLTQTAGGRLRDIKPQHGDKKTKILYEEADGIWLHLQGKDRMAHGEKAEMKLAISYDGIQKLSKGKRRKCAGKTACAGIMPAEEFRKKAESTIRNVYDTEGIDKRILNGDGAEWIFNRDDNVIAQLDIYHRNKALMAGIPDDGLRKEIRSNLYKKDIQGALDLIEAYINSVEDERKKENAEELYTYYDNNKDKMIEYYRRGFKLPEVNEGLSRARLGAMESNVFSLIGNRMKGRRKCWSINGANNMAEILCLKHTGRLDEALRMIDMPVSYFEEETAPDILSASKIPETIGKGYDGYKQADLTHLCTSRYSAIRRLADN